MEPLEPTESGEYIIVPLEVGTGLSLMFTRKFPPQPEHLLIGSVIATCSPINRSPSEQYLSFRIHHGTLHGDPVALLVFPEVLCDTQTGEVKLSAKSSIFIIQEILSKCNHPNICKYFGTYYFPSSGQVMLVTEAVEHTFDGYSAIVRASESIEPEKLYKFCTQLARATVYMHQQGIQFMDGVVLSCDSPSILMGSDGQIKLWFLQNGSAKASDMHYLGRLLHCVSANLVGSDIPDNLHSVIAMCQQDDSVAVLKELLLLQNIVSEDAWKAAYEEALDKQGSVSVEVTRCLFIGPPGVGKSSLKHLLIHNKSKAVQISTPVMEAPDVVRITSEQYALEQGSWQLMEGEVIRHSVQLSALRKEYQLPCATGKQSQVLSAREPRAAPTGGILNTVRKFLNSFTTPTPNDSPGTQATRLRKESVVSSCTNERASQHSCSAIEDLELIFSNCLSDTSDISDAVALNNASFLHLLDSGGQPCFLDVLPLLLAVPCSYVLVFNASQELDQPLPVTYRPRESSTQELISSQTGRELIQRMMSSFHTMGVKHAKDMEHFQAPDTQSPQPSIHLIGTFKDVLLREDRLDVQKKNINRAFRSLSCYPAFRYLAKDDESSTFFLVNNIMTDEEQCSPAEFKYIQHLRSSLSQSKAALRLNVPLLWYLLQQIVSKTDRKLFPYSELKEFAMACRLVNSEKHFFSFVKLFHMLGFFTFFEFSPTPSKESALVCTDTSFFCQEASKILSIQFAKVHSRESRSFQSTGVLGPSSHTVLEELNISKKMDQAWLLKSLVHTGIAAKIDEVSEKLFIPAALPFKEIHSPQASYSVATLCASFKVQEDSFSREFMILHQGVFCKLAVKLASNPLSQCKVIPSESFRSSIKFLCENSHIHLMENINFLEIAVTFEESFPSIAAYSDILEKAHQCCSNVLKMIKTAIAKVSEDMFGPSSIDVGEVVVGFKCTCGADLPHMAVVDEKNLSLRCIGGKKENRLQKLSLNQLVWFRQLAHDGQAQLTLQGTEDSKCFVLQEVSTDAPMPPPCPPCLDQNLDDALVALLPELRTGLSLEDLLSRLERPAGGFMTKTERAKVQALPNPLDRVSEIVDILRKKSNEDFRRFLAILDESGNELWAKTLCARISLDATPSDSGIQEVAIRLKEDSFAVAVLIGVPIEVTDALETVRNGGMKALKHWLDGQCDPQYPISWSSLLSAVEKVAGAETASELKREVQLNSTWSKLPSGKPKM